MRRECDESPVADPIVTMDIGREALRDACLRNQVANVEFVPVDGPCWSARVRLLRCDDTELYVEPPTAGGLPVPVGPNTSVLAYFSVRGQRFVFRSRVSGRARLRLNAALGVEALALERPHDIQYSQRRAHYRVSAPRERPVVCRFSSVADAGHGGEPAVSAPSETPGDESGMCGSRVLWQGRLANISVGGMAVLKSAHDRALVQTGERFRATFDLPPPGGGFHLIVQVRHVRRIERRQDCMVGLQFVGEADGSVMRRSADRLYRYVICQQRRSGTLRPVIGRPSQ